MKTTDAEFDEEFLGAAVRGDVWKLYRLCGQGRITNVRGHVELLARRYSLSPEQLATARLTAQAVRRRAWVIAPAVISACLALYVIIWLSTADHSKLIITGASGGFVGLTYYLGRRRQSPRT